MQNTNGGMYAGNGFMSKMTAEDISSYGVPVASSSIIEVDRANASIAGNNSRYINVEPHISVRPSFSRDDYEAFRPGDMTPTRQKAIIRASMTAYDRVGLIRNVIDLMGDFACQGLTIVHTDPKIEKFYKNWFKKIGGLERSERFLNYLYRCGNVIVNRTNAKITKVREEEFKKTIASSEESILDEVKVYRREIPWSYEFLNPLMIEAKMIKGNKVYYLKINDKTFGSGEITQDNDYLPEYIQNQIKAGKREVLLDSSRLCLHHYKKDDWLVWANPMINPILDDIAMLEKMKLADLSALDGTISQVRLWKVGSLEYKIAPRAPVMNMLRDVLASNVGGGTFDLVWGPDIELIESNSQAYKFLGNAKYEPVLNAIYQGLGISAALAGSGSSGSYTNNYVSIKMLIERLEYGRSILLNFWNEELEIVRKAMKFKESARIHFDSIILSDEAAIKNQLVNLVDRSIMSEETLLERFKEIPEIERIRILREQKARQNNELVPPKMGPFAIPTHKEDMAKIAQNSGNLGKEYFDQLGLPYQDAPEMKPAPGTANKAKPKKAGPAGGRPQNSADKGPRKQKRVLPRTKAADSSVLMWALDAQDKISDALTPVFLSLSQKKNIRSLSKEEFTKFEEMKLCTFLGLEPLSNVDENALKHSMAREVRPSEDFYNEVRVKCSDFVSIHERQPTIEEVRIMYAVIFAENSRI
jgi:hypothetical protein